MKLIKLFSVFILIFSIKTIYSQAPVAQSLSNYVDPLTGDFIYSLPLTTVSGKNGELINIGLSYKAGIKMDQPSGWIGLGWGYDPGEITRDIEGIHDDSPGNGIFQVKSNYSKSEVATFGPIYFKNWNNSYNYSTDDNEMEKAQDIEIKFNELVGTSINGNWRSIPFMNPKYDGYFVHSPGLNGKIKPYLFNGKLVSKKPSTYSFASNNLNFPTSNSTQIPIQFHMENSTANANLNQTLDVTTNRLKSGYYIKYFTNSDIENNYNTIKYNNSTRFGFLDFQIPSGQRRPSASYPSNGIGAFVIVTPEGISYHYSLPVYRNEQRQYSFTFTNLDALNISSSDWEITNNPNKCATSWKLTAITGLDYVDANANGMADIGDEGYWVSYHYTKWSDSYYSASSPYNFKGFYKGQNYSINNNSYTFDKVDRRYEKRGTVIKEKNQVYYLDYIRTSEQTAYFIKEIKEDDIGYEKIQTNGGTKPTPMLKLCKVILMDNSDISLIQNTATIPQNNSNFNYSGVFTGSDAEFMHIAKYTSNQSSIDANALTQIDLNTNYSLCYNNPLNINTNIVNTNAINRISVPSGGTNNDNKVLSVNDNSMFILSLNPANNFSSSNQNQSGRLTLLSVTKFENKKQKIFPSTEFTYSSNNPAYQFWNSDNWGYYKSDFNISTHLGYHTTSTSALNVDAWSLKEIYNGLGSKLIVNYESDSYAYKNDRSEGGPVMFFPIESMNYFDDPSDAIAANMVVKDDDLKNFINTSGALTKVIIPVKGRNANDPTGQFRYMHYEPPINSYSNLSYSGYNFNLTGGSSITINDNSFLTESGTKILSDYASGAKGAGYIWLKLGSFYGGGIRVKDLSITDPSNNLTYSMEFNYSAGLAITPPEPFELEGLTLLNANYNTNVIGVGTGVYYDKFKYKLKSLNSSGSSEYLGSNEFIFNTDATAEWGNSLSTHPTTYTQNQVPISGFCSINCGSVYPKHENKSGNITIGNYKSVDFGKVVENNVYDANDKLIAYKRYKYKVSDAVYESFNSENISFLWAWVKLYQCSSCSTLLGTQTYSVNISYSSGYKKYNSFLSETEIFQDGLVSRTIIDQRDQNTGQIIEETQIDPTKGAIKSKVTPAYTQGTYSDMSMKSNCSTCESNLNTLSVISESKTIKYPLFRSPNGEIKFNPNHLGYILNGNKSVFSKTLPYRQYNTSSGYYENSNATIPFYLLTEQYQLLVDANTPGNATSLNWLKVSTIKSYNKNNQAIDNETLNSRRSGLKAGYNNKFTLASNTNSNLNSFGFTGFEDVLDVDPGAGTNLHFGGEFTKGNCQSLALNGIIPHTGKYFALVNAGSVGPEAILTNFEIGRTYKASVWVHKSSPSESKLSAYLRGSTNSLVEISKSDASNLQVGDWVLMKVEITVPSNYIPSGGTGGINDLRFYLTNSGTQLSYFDDFKFHAIDAPISGYVYDSKLGYLIAELDENNFATIYEYDNSGRLISSYKETELGYRKLSETKYNTSRQ